MSFLGKEFAYESNEGLEAFLTKIGKDASAQDDFKKKIKYTKNGDSYTVVTIKADGTKKETVFKSGVAFDDQLSGSTVKSTITVNGDTVTTEHKSERGGITSTSTYSGDKMVSVISIPSVDVQPKVVYKAV